MQQGTGSRPRTGRLADTRDLWHKEGFTAAVLLSPTVMILAVFFFFPIIFTTVLSFTDFSIIRPWRWVGFDNYIELMGSAPFRRTVVNTAYYTLASVVPSLLLGLLAAVLLNGPVRLRALYRAAIYIPALTSLVAASMVWIWLYDPQSGLLNTILASLGINGPSWLADPKTAMPALIIMNIWRSFGYCMLVYLAGLQNLPDDILEAASLDGAGWSRQLWDIILPTLRPITLFLVVTSTISSFQAFEAIFVMTQGGPNGTTQTIVSEIYSNAFQYSRMGYASAMALALFVLLTAVSAFNLFVVNRRGGDV